jgi:hypothetical protein
MEALMKRFILAVAAICAFVFSAVISYAQDADAVVLTVDGHINGGAAQDYSLQQLEALGLATIETSTPWHNGKVRFEGVPLRRLMEHIGASGKTATVLALNNYRTQIPVSDFTSYPVILAMRKDGAYMPISEKGPLFIIYPFDASQELKSELFYSRSAWQVRKITIE